MLLFFSSGVQFSSIDRTDFAGLQLHLHWYNPREVARGQPQLVYEYTHTDTTPAEIASHLPLRSGVQRRRQHVHHAGNDLRGHLLHLSTFTQHMLLLCTINVNPT